MDLPGFVPQGSIKQRKLPNTFRNYWFKKETKTSIVLSFQTITWVFLYIMSYPKGKAEIEFVVITIKKGGGIIIV